MSYPLTKPQILRRELSAAIDKMDRAARLILRARVALQDMEPTAKAVAADSERAKPVREAIAALITSLRERAYEAENMVDVIDYEMRQLADLIGARNP